MTRLRKMMLEELQRRNFSEDTIRHYIHTVGPFQEFYTALLTKGLRPEMARLTLARNIAPIVLMVWKRGACFDAQHLKPQTA